MLSTMALTVTTPDDRTVAIWRYNTIRDFSCSPMLFCFTSGRRGPYGVHKYIFKVSGSLMPSLLSTLSTITGVDIMPMDVSGTDVHSENLHTSHTPPPAPPIPQASSATDHHSFANANFYSDVTSVTASVSSTPTSSLFQVSPPNTLPRDLSNAAHVVCQQQTTPPPRIRMRAPHFYEEITDSTCTDTAKSQQNGCQADYETIPPSSNSSTSRVVFENLDSFPMPPAAPAVNQLLPIAGSEEAPPTKAVPRAYEAPVKAVPRGYEVAQSSRNADLHRGTQLQSHTSRTTAPSQGPTPYPGHHLQAKRHAPSLAALSSHYEMSPAFSASTPNLVSSVHSPHGSLDEPSPLSFGVATRAQAVADPSERTDGDVRACAGILPPNGGMPTERRGETTTHPQSGHLQSQEVSPVGAAQGTRPTKGWTSPLPENAVDRDSPTSPPLPCAVRAVTPDDLAFSCGNEEEYEVLTPRSDRRILLCGRSPHLPLYENWAPPPTCNTLLKTDLADDSDGYVVMRESAPKTNLFDCYTPGEMEEDVGVPAMAEGDAVPTLGVVHHVIKPTNSDNYSNVCLRVQVVTGGGDP